MNPSRLIGLFLFIIGFAAFNLSLFLSEHRYSTDAFKVISNQHHREALQAAADEMGLEQLYGSNLTFIASFKPLFKKAQATLDKQSGVDPANNIWNATTLPEGVSEWDFRMGDWFYKDYLMGLTRTTTVGGFLPQNKSLFFWLSFILTALGACIYFLPELLSPAGIKNNGIFHNSVTKGSSLWVRILFLGLVGLGVCLLGFGGKAYLSLGKEFAFLPTLLTVLGAAAIILLVWFAERKWKIGARTVSPVGNGWLGLLLGIYLIGFYIVLYFYPEYLSNWILMVDPISLSLSGGPASQWFLYGFLYCLVMSVMGIRMFIKYRHNRYQLVRTGSVLFFQLSFAFIIPELLVRFNNPWMDLKNAWPLDYTFFYEYRIDGYLQAKNELLGIHVGTAMFVWGIVLMAGIVPLFTYLFGKRWYCSWVCGCGGLAETLGDPFRQQSDKSLRAWRIERYLIHAVLVFATVMTVLLLVSYCFHIKDFQIVHVDQVKTWYGFLIGSAFAGVVGTGFYPIMGNRVWCRFGCPLAALMGIVQRFKSRFRITTNGGQCISCGNCSTYCEMGIDVRWYAQRGQDIVRASCVGCGICSAVCPRGVLRLENASEDINERTETLRVLHISKEGVSLVD